MQGVREDPVDREVIALVEPSDVLAHDFPAGQDINAVWALKLAVGLLAEVGLEPAVAQGGRRNNRARSSRKDSRERRDVLAGTDRVDEVAAATGAEDDVGIAVVVR